MTHADPTVALHSTVEREFTDLRRGVEILVWRMGLARTRDEAIALGAEALQEAVRRALDQASSFDPKRSAHAWLLGIAINVLREQRRQLSREQRHCVGSMDSPLESSTNGGATGIYDSLIIKRVHDLAAEQDQNLHELLDLVPPQTGEYSATAMWIE
jgi:DNA-directed RNA polymerase specialized sigma24 family protein